MLSRSRLTLEATTRVLPRGATDAAPRVERDYLFLVRDQRGEVCDYLGIVQRASGRP
jgi:hypothetical protein